MARINKSGTELPAESKVDQENLNKQKKQQIYKAYQQDVQAFTNNRIIRSQR